VSSLSAAGQDHQGRLEGQLERIPRLADALAEQPLPDDVALRFLDLQAFIAETLRPHMQAVEERVYPELERLMQARHSMAQMRREHRDLESLLASLGEYRVPRGSASLEAATTVRLRRVLYRVYALLKVHLAEEAEYLRVLERTLSEDEQAELVRRIEEAGARPL
jgi:hypothetical protein